MSDARDDKDRVQRNRKKKQAASVFTPSEDIGRMHLSAENYSTAIEYFQKALESHDLKDYPDRFRILLAIADCYRKKGGYDDAESALAHARNLLGEEPDPVALGKIEYREAFVLLARGGYDDALKKGFRAYRRLKRSDEHREVAYVQIVLAGSYQRLGMMTEAEEFFMDALSSFRRIDDRVGVAYVYNNLGLLHKNACRWNRALASLSKSLELATSLGLTQHQLLVHLNLGVVHAKLRRFTEALAAFSQAEEMSERFGDQYTLTKALFMKGRTYIRLGEYVKAEKYILRGQAMANEYGYKRESALTDEFIGELMMARNKPDEALVNLKKGLKTARTIAPEGDVVAEILRRMGDVYYMLGHVDKALAVIDEGLAVAESCGEFYEIGYFHRTKGLCLSRRRDFTGAVDSLERSVAAFGQYGNDYEKYLSQQILGRTYTRRRGQGDLTRARQVLSDSVLGFGQLDESRDQMMAHVLLAGVEERLGNLDDALLALYEADRLADEIQDRRFRKMLPSMRARIEGKMTRDTTRVLEQIPVLGMDQGGLRSRHKLVAGLESTLQLIMDKANAQNGFIAVAGPGGKGFDVVCRREIGAREAKAILAWHADRSGDTEGEHALLFQDAGQVSELAAVVPGVPCGSMVFQALGFEGDRLGLIFVNQDPALATGPIGQEALHFAAAYSRLISLSVYELTRNERRREPKEKPAGSGFESIVTENNEMIKLLNLAERVAHSNATVLLQGETGTGKGLIAYAVHLLSDRREKPFVHINCAAMPETLLESELFGHVKGAFTGADSDKNGLLREADGGTIFLDEIGKTSLAMQGKLLQFLDSNKVRKVGSSELTGVDVRVICASKGDLLAMCEDGRFLEDFFYRINDFPLTVPPLRKRKEDIELLFFHYLRKFSREMGKSIVDVTDEAMSLLKAYHWAGNVRELEKVVKRAVILADDGDSIDLPFLPPEVTAATAKRSVGEGGGTTLRDRIERLERTEIQSALEQSGWNKSQAATRLGISYPSLLSKIKRYGIRSY